jgi:hypothetical protein
MDKCTAPKLFAALKCTPQRLLRKSLTLSPANKFLL